MFASNPSRAIRAVEGTADHVATLGAVSYHRNDLHHRWLRAIGFRFLAEVGVGPFSIPYAAYERRQEVST